MNEILETRIKHKIFIMVKVKVIINFKIIAIKEKFNHLVFPKSKCRQARFSFII